RSLQSCRLLSFGPRGSPSRTLRGGAFSAKKAHRRDPRRPKRQSECRCSNTFLVIANSVGAKTCRRADSSRVCLDSAPCCESVLGDYLRFFFAFLFSSTAA